MKVLMSALFIVLIGFVSNLSAQTTQAKTEEQIQGKWQAVKILFKGEKILTKEQVEATQLEFLAGGVHKTKLENGEIVFGKYTIDTRRNPFWLTFEGNLDAPDPYNGIIINSLFKINGNKLTIVSNTGIRPIDFTSDEINQNILEEYVRVKE
jgi:uncharacterized protein (TIGR03067 family)